MTLVHAGTQTPGSEFLLAEETGSILKLSVGNSPQGLVLPASTPSTWRKMNVGGVSTPADDRIGCYFSLPVYANLLCLDPSFREE